MLLDYHSRDIQYLCLHALPLKKTKHRVMSLRCSNVHFLDVLILNLFATVRFQMALSSGGMAIPVFVVRLSYIIA